MMPFTFGQFAHKWMADPAGYVMAALGAGAVFAFIMLLLSTKYKKYPRLPFIMSLLIFIAAFGGVGIGFYPYLSSPVQ